MTHISIDLDYFLYEYIKPQNSDRLEKECNAVLRYVFSSRKPVKVYRYHHHILTDLNQVKYDTIINIDYHSDLSRTSEALETGLEEGNWANFYVHKADSTFLWVYPDHFYCVVQGYGRCDKMPHPFVGEPFSTEDYPAMPVEEMGWKTVVTHERGINHFIKKADTYSICLSEDWCDKKLYDKVVKKFKLLNRVQPW